MSRKAELKTWLQSFPPDTVLGCGCNGCRHALRNFIGSLDIYVYDDDPEHGTDVIAWTPVAGDEQIPLGNWLKAYLRRIRTEPCELLTAQDCLEAIAA